MDQFMRLRNPNMSVHVKWPKLASIPPRWTKQAPTPPKRSQIMVWMWMKCAEEVMTHRNVWMRK